MKDYYKNKPHRNRSIGIVTSLYIACIGAFFIEGMVLLDAYTSITGWTYEVREGMPFLYVFGIGALVFYLLMKRIKRNVYYEMEGKLDD